MKIISKYKDYYDCMANTIGIDTNIVFTRNNTKELNELEHPGNLGQKTLIDNSVAKMYIVGFAGKLYPVMCVINKSIYSTVNSKILIVKTWIYDINKMREIISEKCKLNYKNENDSQIMIDKVIQLTKNISIEKIFHDNQVGSFIIWYYDRKDGYHKTLEPILADINFFKCVDQFTAFLQMQTFISEQLRPMMPEVQLSDKEKVVSKGFDPKYGFRKRK